MEKTEKDTNSLRRVIENIEKAINDGQKKVKDSLNKLKNSNILESDWISILAVTSNPIRMDFLIEGIPQVYYDVFEKVVDNEKVVEIVLDISDVAKEDIRISTRYKTIKIYIKDYLVKKINLKKYLKKSIRVKNVNCQYKGRILKIRIKK